MQVEQQHRVNSSAWDIADILHPELYAAPNIANPNPSPSTSFSSPSSRESTPMSQHLPTPPQQPPYPAFPSVSATASNPMDLASDSFFSFLDAGDMEGKGAASASSGATQQSNSDPFNNGSNSFDFNFGFDFASLPMMMTSPMPAGGPQSASEYGMDMNAFMSGLGMDSAMDMGIDPQLVDSPAPLVTMGEDGDQAEEEVEEQEEEEAEEAPAANTRSSNRKKDNQTESIASTRSKRGRKATISTNTQPRPSSSSPTATSPTQQDSQKGDKLTLTIAPVKVGGRGGARRGTVQSGGITKKTAAPVPGANGPMYSGSILKVVKEDAGKENNGSAASATKGRGRGRRGTTSAPAATLPSPPSSHHDGEDMEEDASAAAAGMSPTPFFG